MQGGIGEGDAVLIEVIADGDLATEGVTTRIEIHFVVLIVASLYHHGHVEVGITDGIDNTNLETEVGQ